MNFELYDLALFIGIVCLIFAGFLTIVLAFPESARFSILQSRHRKTLMDDYKDSKIAAGGIIGLIKWLLISGIILICIGLIIGLLVWLIS